MGNILKLKKVGACNILRKSKQNFDYEKLCKGLLADPVRIRLLAD